MEHNIPDLPMPRPAMMITIGIAYILGHIGRMLEQLGHMEHGEVTMYLSNGACLCAFIKYGYEFGGWLRKRHKIKKG